MATRLEQLRVAIPNEEVVERGNASDYFDVLPNNQGLTEEYLYAHQPTMDRPIAVYSTSSTPIGWLDDTAQIREQFAVIAGPVIVVARKGYAGRLFVAEDEHLIVHEDAYAISPKPAYSDHIVLTWFAGHYSFEFQTMRTSMWGIGDFPRERMRVIDVVLPRIPYQQDVAALYSRRDRLLSSIAALRSEAEIRVAHAAGL